MKDLFMKKKLFSLFLVIATCLVSMPLTAASKQEIALVDFGTCIQESKYGKREIESFENLKKQLHAILDDAEKQLNDVITKLQDQDYLDGLSPAGEQELKQKFQALSEELNRYQAQYYQIMQQANMRIVQAMSVQINKASEAVARGQKIPVVMNKEAAFYFEPNLDITNSVVKQMDKEFEIADKEGKLPDTALMKADPSQLLNQPQGGLLPNA